MFDTNRHLRRRTAWLELVWQSSEVVPDTLIHPWPHIRNVLRRYERSFLHSPSVKAVSLLLFTTTYYWKKGGSLSDFYFICCFPSGYVFPYFLTVLLLTILDDFWFRFGAHVVVFLAVLSRGCVFT